MVAGMNTADDILLELARLEREALARIRAKKAAEQQGADFDA